VVQGSPPRERENAGRSRPPRGRVESGDGTINAAAIAESTLAESVSHRCFAYGRAPGTASHSRAVPLALGLRPIPRNDVRSCSMVVIVDHPLQSPGRKTPCRRSRVIGKGVEQVESLDLPGDAASAAPFGEAPGRLDCSGASRAAERRPSCQLKRTGDGVPGFWPAGNLRRGRSRAAQCRRKTDRAADPAGRFRHLV